MVLPSQSQISTKTREIKGVISIINGAMSTLQTVAHIQGVYPARVRETVKESGETWKTRELRNHLSTLIPTHLLRTCWSMLVSAPSIDSLCVKYQGNDSKFCISKVTQRSQARQIQQSSNRNSFICYCTALPRSVTAGRAAPLWPSVIRAKLTICQPPIEKYSKVK